MSLTPILIGGIIPAFLFAISGIFLKMSQQSGVAAGAILIATGIGVALTGFLFLSYDRSPLVTSGTAWALMYGVAWAFGNICIVFALQRFHIPFSKLIPLYNMNTLIGVFLSLVIFAEWQNVNMIKLLSGSILVVIGGILVSLS